MSSFLDRWVDAALTALGFFWTAFWAFGFGYLVSALIKTFVTETRMKRAMGGTGAKEMGLATVFGFVSSSCSFAALSATRSIFAKGASLAASLAFLLASTNLVIELGIVIALFLSWQFVVGEYVGGLILIAVVWGLLRIWKPEDLVEQAREAVDDGGDDGKVPDWHQLIRSKDGWAKVAKAYVGEWRMVWKDVTVGFTVAGAIAAFVPPSFFQALFIGSGEQDLALWKVAAQSLIGPVAAFFTFIGSMGNIPLAAILYGSGVSFAGVMAFLFSDLVVFPVVRIQAKYYGWRFALFVVALFLIAIVVAAVALHYGFALAGLMPEGGGGAARKSPLDSFSLNHAFWFNMVFLALSALAVGWALKRDEVMSVEGDWIEQTLTWLAVGFLVWLAGGVGLWAFGWATVTKSGA